MNKTQWFCTCLLLVLFGASNANSNAATLQLYLDYAASYLGDYSQAPYDLADARCCDPVAPDDIHQFDVSVRLLDAVESPEESLGALIFDALMGPGVTPWAPQPWLAFPNSLYDPPGPFPPRQLFTDNADVGFSPEDLQRIVVITDRVAAHGLDPGESGPQLIGHMFVHWDQSVAFFSTLQLVPHADEPEPWALWVDEELVIQPASTMFSSVNPRLTPAFDFSILLCLPEPASGGLAITAALGLLGLVLRRR